MRSTLPTGGTFHAKAVSHLDTTVPAFIGNGTLAGTPLGNAGYKYLLIDPPDGGDYDGDDLTDVAGIKAQGNDNPRSIFADHTLVLYSASGHTKLYGPSYGLGPYDTPEEWKADVLAGQALELGEMPNKPGHVQLAVKKL